jgi:DNA-binding LacI/PurR family transcriptional regulator
MPDAGKRPTIRQLALETGLSPAAVSYALRGIQVSVETQERVREVADRLGYEVDPIARALRGGHTGTIGLLVGSLSDFWHQSLVNEVQRVLRSLGRSLLVADADGDAELGVDLARKLVDQRVDALIVSPVGRPVEDWHRLADRVPIVTLGAALPGIAVAGEVIFDNDRGVALTLRHLQAQGHRQICVLSWLMGEAVDRTAERALEAWSDRYGIQLELQRSAFTLDGAASLAREILVREDRPTAFFCLSDSFAYGVYLACRQLGLDIPGDVSVVGFDDFALSVLVDPPLTSTGWDLERAASLAVDAAIRAVEGEEPSDADRTLIEPTLTLRASTGPPAPRPD